MNWRQYIFPLWQVETDAYRYWAYACYVLGFMVHVQLLGPWAFPKYMVSVTFGDYVGFEIIIHRFNLYVRRIDV